MYHKPRRVTIHMQILQSLQQSSQIYHMHAQGLEAHWYALIGPAVYAILYNFLPTYLY
jgi:hypothetical protein